MKERISVERKREWEEISERKEEKRLKERKMERGWKL